MAVSEQHRRLSRARTSLIITEPFFGVLSTRLIMQERRGVKTAATDGKYFFYEPSYIDKLTDSQLKGLWGHEVLHCSNGHVWRRGDRDHSRWNWACDYAIDPILIASGLDVPDPAVNSDYAGMPAEQIYTRLQEEQPQKPDEQQPGSQSPNGTPAGTPQPSDGDGQQPGSGGGGNKGEAPTKGQVLDPCPESDTPHEDAANWVVATIQAANAARAQGKLPAHLEAMVEQIKESRVDWRSNTRRWVQQMSASDYSWRQPSPRYLSGGFYLPRVHDERLGPIVVFGDTSGSCIRDQERFFGELNAILEEASPSMIWFVQIDAKVQDVQELEPGMPIKQTIHGGGGTDFRPGFKWVEEQGIEPVGAIFCTDLYGDFPDEEPPYPVLWASTTKSPPDHYRPPFGETVFIGDD